MHRIYHIMPAGHGQWRILAEIVPPNGGAFSTKGQAWTFAQKLAEGHPDSHVVIHRYDYEEQRDVDLGAHPPAGSQPSDLSFHEALELWLASYLQSDSPFADRKLGHPQLEEG